MKVKIGFSDRNKFNLWSWAAKVWMGTEYSHNVITFIEPSTGIELIVEASYGEVHLITKENWLKKNTMIKEYDFEISEEGFKYFMGRALGHLQKPYAYLQLLGIALNLKIFNDGDKSFLCTELVNDLLGISTNEIMTPSTLEYILDNELYHKR